MGKASRGKWERKLARLEALTKLDPVLQKPKTLVTRLLDFIEHPLFTTTVGIVGGIVGLLYTPSLVVTVLCVALAFHRAEVVRQYHLCVQVLSYCIVICLASLGVYYVAHSIRRSAHIPTASEIAAAVWTGHSDNKRSYPASFMQFENALFRKEHSRIEGGKELQLNVFFKQVGPEFLKRVDSEGVLFTLPTSMQDPTNKAHEIALRPILKAKNNWMEGRTAGSAIGVGKGLFGTSHLLIANQSDADDIRSGKLRIYYIGYVAWLDPEGKNQSVDVCEWLQAPLPIDMYPSENQIWHFC